ncbi:Limbic system-associated membrane protein [Mizuhopecten yessoensis]|uniref:Limbic system-associated membrane protein n=1 Tax=Mizuhopecten yessoensis TaxID=6573 RepID=A0A210QZE4_MIZYE|nr:Limbic system-associated membrane protein [Mizuhopecten yessoensis]
MDVCQFSSYKMPIRTRMTVPSFGIRIIFLSSVIVFGQALSDMGNAVEDIPVNVTVAEGKTAILPCRVDDDYDDIMVVWMNPKRIVVSQKESRFINDPRMSIERPFMGDYNLHIRSVKYEDRGDYMCTINTQPVTIKRIRLIIQVPSRILDYSSSNVVTVRERSDVELVCNATGVPPPTITWYRRTDESPQGRDRVGKEGEVLVIRNISRYCGGIYECMAFNGVPPAVQRQIEVKVHFKPEISLLSKRMGQYLDKETMLECIITASPQGSNVWRFGNVQPDMKEGWKYHLEVFEDSKYTVSLTLRIKTVRPEDFGTYTCEAANQLGHSKRDMVLYEYIVPTPPQIPTVSSTTYRVEPNNPYDDINTIGGRQEGVTIRNQNRESAQIHKSSETQILGNSMLIISTTVCACWIKRYLSWVGAT